MNFCCQGRRLNWVPASGPAVTGRDSTKAMTRSARLRPGNSHGCGSDEFCGAADEPCSGRVMGFAPGPRKPMLELTDFSTTRSWLVSRWSFEGVYGAGKPQDG